jgi:hypothetical protein
VAELTASASARASVILLNMIGLLVWKPEVASADQITQREVYFDPGTRLRFARCTFSCAQ